MIQITPQMHILVAVEPVDFRNEIDGWARLYNDVLKHDPFGGRVFVFRNRSLTALQVLIDDGQGFWLCHKRLSSGRFCWWPAGKNAVSWSLATHALPVLLSAGNPEATQAAPAWRSVGPADCHGFSCPTSDIALNRSCIFHESVVLLRPRKTTIETNGQTVPDNSY